MHALKLTLMQSTTLPIKKLKWKQNFPAVIKSSLMKLYLNQEHHAEQQHIANHQLLMSSSWKTSCYLSI